MISSEQECGILIELSAAAFEEVVAELTKRGYDGLAPAGTFVGIDRPMGIYRKPSVQADAAG